MPIQSIVSVTALVSRDFVVRRVRDFILSLNIPVSDSLAYHAATVKHEDLHQDHECSESCTVSPRTLTPASSVRSVRDRLHSLIPPVNYGAVLPGIIYRSGYPQEKNYDFLKHVKIKTILTLVPEALSPEYQAFIDEAGIQHFQVHIHANKGGVRVETCQMSRALRILLNREHHPILIHCNKGKHRTGCTVACFRRILSFEMDEIRDEYHTYAGVKARFFDEAFFENFDLNPVMWFARNEGWLAPEVKLGFDLELAAQPVQPPIPEPVVASAAAQPLA